MSISHKKQFLKQKHKIKYLIKNCCKNEKFCTEKGKRRKSKQSWVEKKKRHENSIFIRETEAHLSVFIHWLCLFAFSMFIIINIIRKVISTGCHRE